MTLQDKCKWDIFLPEERRITVRGKTLNQAVKEYGKKHPRKLIECGLLVRVKHLGINYYWSGEKMLELLN